MLHKRCHGCGYSIYGGKADKFASTRGNINCYRVISGVTPYSDSVEPQANVVMNQTLGSTATTTRRPTRKAHRPCHAIHAQRTTPPHNTIGLAITVAKIWQPFNVDRSKLVRVGPPKVQLSGVALAKKSACRAADSCAFSLSRVDSEASKMGCRANLHFNPVWAFHVRTYSPASGQVKGCRPGRNYYVRPRTMRVFTAHPTHQWILMQCDRWLLWAHRAGKFIDEVSDPSNFEIQRRAIHVPGLLVVPQLFTRLAVSLRSM